MTSTNRHEGARVPGSQSAIDAVAATARAPRLGELPGTVLGRLALGLLAVELLGGMQVLVTATLLPTVAGDLGGRSWYAAALAASAATVFVTMPVAGPLVDRMGPARVLVILAPVYAAGAALSAAAPAMWVYVAGRGVQGLASGGLATVALGTVGGVLPAAWRPRLFALTAAMWIVPGLVGPAYAAGLAGLVGWRWAHASLAPLLLATGAAVVRSLRAREREGAGTDAEPDPRPLGLGAALVLAACMAVVALAAEGRPATTVAGVAAATGAIAVSRRLLVPGALTLRPGRPAAIGGLLLVSGAFLSVNAVIAIVAREAFGASRLGGGLTLSVGVLAWALASVARSRRGAASSSTLAPGAMTLAVGLGVAAVAAATTSLPLLVAGWAAAGTGMGLAYPALLELAFGADEPGGAGVTAASAVLAEALGGWLGAVVAGAAVTVAVRHAGDAPGILAAMFAAAAALAAGLCAVARRVTDVSPAA